MNLGINKKIILTSFIIVIFTISFASAVIVNAQEGFVPLQEIPKVIDAETAKDPSKFFNAMFKFGIIIAGFLAVVMIAIGGIQYMSTDAVSGKGEGREKITYALMGLLLILFSYILLKTINPDILKFDLFKTSPSPSSSIPKYSDKQSTPEEVAKKTAERIEEKRKQDIRTIEQKIKDLKSISPVDAIEEGLIEDQISDLEKQLKLKQK